MFGKTVKKKIITIPFFSRCVQVIRLLFTLNICLTTIQIFRLSSLICLKKHRRWIAFKYAGNYLGRSFSCRCRGAILINHYKFINNYFPKGFTETLITSRVVLWEKLLGVNLYTVTLQFPYYDMEGDMAVQFNVNGCGISIVSFSIINGNMVGVGSKQAIFIARVQGTKWKFDLIRQATKDLNEVTPNALLVIAVQAIATALKIERIAGVATKEHIDLDDFHYNYDELWISMGGDKVNEHVFHLPTAPHNKPMAMVKVNHRCRTKQKRQFKVDIYNQIILAFEQKCLNLS